MGTRLQAWLARKAATARVVGLRTIGSRNSRANATRAWPSAAGTNGDTIPEFRKGTLATVVLPGTSAGHMGDRWGHTSVRDPSTDAGLRVRSAGRPMRSASRAGTSPRPLHRG